LERLAKKPDSEIDYSDALVARPIPARIQVGRFYRPTKQQISLRVDADVLAWYRSRGRRYQDHMNEALRRVMQAGPNRQ